MSVVSQDFTWLRRMLQSQQVDLPEWHHLGHPRDA